MLRVCVKTGIGRALGPRIFPLFYCDVRQYLVSRPDTQRPGPKIELVYQFGDSYRLSSSNPRKLPVTRHITRLDNPMPSKSENEAI